MGGLVRSSCTSMTGLCYYFKYISLSADKLNMKDLHLLCAMLSYPSLFWVDSHQCNLKHYSIIITCAQCVLNTIMHVSGSTPCRLRACWFLRLLVPEDIISSLKISPAKPYSISIENSGVGHHGSASQWDGSLFIVSTTYSYLVLKKNKTQTYFITK